MSSSPSGGLDVDFLGATPPVGAVVPAVLDLFCSISVAGDRGPGDAEGGNRKQGYGSDDGGYDPLGPPHPCCRDLFAHVSTSMHEFTTLWLKDA